MKKTIVYLILLAAAFTWMATVANAAPPAEDDKTRTSGLYNGRVWNEISEDWKQGFVVGFSDWDPHFTPELGQRLVMACPGNC